MAIFMLLLPAKNFTESEFVMQALENSPQIRVALVEDDVNFQNALMVAIEDAPDMTLLGVAGTKTQGFQCKFQAFSVGILFNHACISIRARERCARFNSKAQLFNFLTSPRCGAASGQQSAAIAPADLGCVLHKLLRFWSSLRVLRKYAAHRLARCGERPRAIWRSRRK